MLDSLNQRQKMFVHNYLKGLNATRSCIEAGYSSNAATASVTGHRLLRNAKVKNSIEYLNEQSGITPSRLVSKLASVYHHKNTKVSDLIKLTKLFFKIEGIDFNEPSPRRPTRSKKEAGVVSYSLNSLIKPNGDTYNKEVIEEVTEEDNLLKIEQAVPKSIPKAVPMQIQKALPKPTELKKPLPAYSPFNFRDEDEVNRTQNNRTVFYPA